ncbi:hypothetical protein [Sphingomonas daechungensis]|uniref:hypothetical protein n=1 Tax=Sphingomonas daechungensis TaxID=1176646 RepID=UPI0037842970
MRTRILLALGLLGAASACSTPDATYPSLAPRPQEAIDPRVPIPNVVRVDPADPNLSAHLAALIDQAQSGDQAFQAAAANAERLASSAGPQPSESWVAAQQALSAAQEARGPTVQALGDIDGIAAAALQKQGGIPAGNLAAIQTAADKVAAIDDAEASRIDAIEKRLGL